MKVTALLLAQDKASGKAALSNLSKAAQEVNRIELM